MKIATICYIKKDGKTLMLHRVKKQNDMHKDKWVGVGGKLEPGESPEECVIREVKEESGLTLIKPKLRGILTFPAYNNMDDWLVFLYTADKFSGKMIESNEGDLEWIDDSKLFDLNLWEEDKVFLKWLDYDKIFSAKFFYKNDSFSEYKVEFY